jgi:hypothetical protein
MDRSRSVVSASRWQKGTHTGQLTANESVIILPSLTNDQARARFRQGWIEPKPYLRIIQL